MDQPNPITVALSVLGSLRVRHPAPTGSDRIDHSDLAPVLKAIAAGGIAELGAQEARLSDYVAETTAFDPDRLDWSGALAYWVNLYNALALQLAGEAGAIGHASVLRIPRAFSRRIVDVAGERLSLHDIEHGKIRRFGDPRIHAALVCGSASCPTLRFEPFSADRVHLQMDDQMRSFLAAGGAVVEEGRLLLSRVFLWYGADFVKPYRMPALIPVRKSRIARALVPWLADDLAGWVRTGNPAVAFQAYDWGLACTVR